MPTQILGYVYLVMGIPDCRAILWLKATSDCDAVRDGLHPQLDTPAQ